MLLYDVHHSPTLRDVEQTMTCSEPGSAAVRRALLTHSEGR